MRRLARFLLVALALALLLSGAGLAWSVREIRKTPWRDYDAPRLANGYPDPGEWARQFWAVDDPSKLPFAHEDVTIPAAPGITLAGWYFPAGETLTARGGGAPAIVIAHGGGTDARSCLKYASFLHARGFALLLFDLRDHGRSTIDRQGLTFGWREHEDVLAARRFLSERKGHRWVGAFGDSVGGASVLLAAAKDVGIRAVCAQNAYADLREFTADQVERKGAPRALGAVVSFALERAWPAPPENVRPVDAIARISPRPVLIVQGSLDSLCRAKHADALYAAAREPRSLLMIEGGRHATLWNSHQALFEEKVGGFFEVSLLADTGRP